MIADNIIQNITIMVLPLLFAITLHEVAHGWVALFFGDQTARLAGRLSLNPLKHIDPIGTVLVPLFMLVVTSFAFGWAKPVPVDERNLRNPRRDMIFVALAGPLANVLMAFFWGFIAKLGAIIEMSGNQWWGVPLGDMGIAGIMINAVLGVLNLIPIPPLDGGRVLTNLLPRRAAYRLSMLEPYSFMILVLLLISGVLNSIMRPIVIWLFNAISSIYRLT